MRMRDRDGGDTTERTDRFHGGIIQQAHTVPEHVAVRGADQKRALSDRKSGYSTNAGQVRGDLLDAVVIFLLHFGDCRPALTFLPDVLAFILANGTMGGRRDGSRVLDSASGANIVCHGFLLGSG